MQTRCGARGAAVDTKSRTYSAAETVDPRTGYAGTAERSPTRRARQGARVRPNDATAIGSANTETDAYMETTRRPWSPPTRPPGEARSPHRRREKTELAFGQLDLRRPRTV